MCAFIVPQLDGGLAASVSGSASSFKTPIVSPTKTLKCEPLPMPDGGGYFAPLTDYLLPSTHTALLYRYVIGLRVCVVPTASSLFLVEPFLIVPNILSTCRSFPKYFHSMIPDWTLWTCRLRLGFVQQFHTPCTFI